MNHHPRSLHMAVAVRVVLLTVVTVACAIVVPSLAAAVPPAPAAGQVAPASCVARAGESRWLAESYSETHTYGLGDAEEWIASYGGLTAAGDTLFFYDPVRPRVVHLSGKLEERAAFGRSGEGPGEFRPARFAIPWVDDMSEGHVAFDGRRLVVYDRLKMASFDADGDFGWSVRLPQLSLVYGIRFVGPLDEEEMIFGIDSLDAESRRLQLWSVNGPAPDDRELLWQRAVPTVAREFVAPGVVSDFHRREARSYWARYRDCVVVSDGGRQSLWVVHLSTLRSDSIVLPEWDVPEFGELPTDRSVMNIGGREAASRPQGPGLLWRWRGLIVDPDGHAWLRAWTDSREEHQVFVVSMASGESRQLDLPGFPAAFGRQGVFYTARQRPGTDETYLVRFEGR